MDNLIILFDVLDAPVPIGTESAQHWVSLFLAVYCRVLAPLFTLIDEVILH